jgi:hypothetical protein
VEGGKSRFKQVDRERSLQALMTTNLLKRLESSVESFRLTLKSLQKSHRDALEKIATFKQTGTSTGFADITAAFADADLDDADFDDNHLPLPGDSTIGKKIQINLEDMDLPSWEPTCKAIYSSSKHCWQKWPRSPRLTTPSCNT